MTWPKIVLLTYHALSALLVISQIGKPRASTLTAGVGVITVLTIGVLAWLVVMA